MTHRDNVAQALAQVEQLRTLLQDCYYHVASDGEFQNSLLVHSVHLNDLRRTLDMQLARLDAAALEGYRRLAK